MKHVYTITLQWKPVIVDGKPTEVVVDRLRVGYDENSERDIAEDIGVALAPRFGMTRIRTCSTGADGFVEWSR